MSTTYQDFLQLKTQSGADRGFDPVFMPPALFDFQRSLVEWAVRRGRAAIFADCGLGKTAMQLTWAQNVAQYTGRPVLILTPLAVAAQTIREGEKFGIECSRSADGTITSQIVITNYERMEHFSPADFAEALSILAASLDMSPSSSPFFASVSASCSSPRLCTNASP